MPELGTRFHAVYLLFPSGGIQRTAVSVT